MAYFPFFYFSQMDRAAFTLDRPQSATKPGLVRVTSSQDIDSDNNKPATESPQTNGKVSRAQTRSSLHVEGALSRYYSLLDYLVLLYYYTRKTTKAN